jgi:hypothetical protein
MGRKNENARKVHKGPSNCARRRELAYLRPAKFVVRSDGDAVRRSSKGAGQ